MHLKAIYKEQCGLGEGAYWHPLQQKFYWIDIRDQRVHCFDPVSDDTKTWQLDGLVSAMCAIMGDKFIIGYENSIAEFDPSSGAIKELWKAESGLRMNDGAVDPMGRFWIGEADIENHKSNLYCYDVAGNCEIIEKDLAISNGLDWDVERGIFYLADSLDQVIYAYDYDINSGKISNRRDLIRFAEGEGYPDGFVLDSEGYLWCCMWEGYAVHRISPEGEIVETIKTPMARPTKCAFGGSDLKTLYITSASGDVGSDLQLPEPAGFVYVTQVSVSGRLMTIFGSHM